jgi:hypothetical protein
VKNEAARPYSGTIAVEVLDGSGKLVGTFYGAVDDVPPGEEAVYVALGPAPAGWTRVEVRVSQQTPQ